MDEFEVIAERLRRHRKDLEALIESAASRSGETADLIGKIEELRRRSEETTQRFNTAVVESDPARAK